MSNSLIILKSKNDIEFVGTDHTLTEQQVRGLLPRLEATLNLKLRYEPQYTTFGNLMVHCIRTKNVILTSNQEGDVARFFAEEGIICGFKEEN
jgi:hypothetical protein